MNAGSAHRAAQLPRPDTCNSTHWDLVVVVPARNEASHIAASLQSILRAVAVAAESLHDVRIVLVADRCTDQTAAIAKSVFEHSPAGVVAHCDEGNVARARSFGVAVGRSKLVAPDPGRTWIANTDADTVVRSDWIVQQLQLADLGLCAVAGTIEIRDFPGLPASARRHFAAHYTDSLPATGPHPHVHAANLGVRLDAYDLAGAWGDLSRSEDRDLWNRLSHQGLPIASVSELKVSTSGRSVGRIRGGFADWLREHVRERDESASGQTCRS